MRFFCAALLVTACAVPVIGQTSQKHLDDASSDQRIVAPVDETVRVQLRGNTHPLAKAKFDAGLVPDALQLKHMSLQLKRSPEKEQALLHRIDQMQDPSSATYHQWLSAETLGKNYGPSAEDIDTISAWLKSYGLQVDAAHKSGMSIDFSGNAGQVREAFQTEIHYYNVKGQQHLANATDPSVPVALSSVLAGVVSLHDFKPKSELVKPKRSFSFDQDEYGEQYDVAPADFAKIYNVSPLYQASKPITGAGQTIVVLERTDISSADVHKFRSSFGLSGYKGQFTQIHPGTGCADPGTNADESEAALDAEWSGAVAPDANVELASCADTETSFGPLTAAQNLLDEKNPPKIMSLSYGGCETDQGAAYNAFINSVWQQAASEGVSIFVSSGDADASGCEDPDLFPDYATTGIAANGLASTPYNLAAGGTDFSDTSANTVSTYWSKSNSASGKSVLSYVPEMTWNDSCAGSVLYYYYGYKNGLAFCNSEVGSSDFIDVIGGSGAPSFVYAKPSWQAAVFGNPNDHKRDLPDVSLFASSGFWNHALLFCMSDANEGGVPCDYSNPTDALYNSAGGTSFVAPQLAGIEALINQKDGPQGNAAPEYYRLATAEYGTVSSPNTAKLLSCSADQGKETPSSCVFHDVKLGNNAVPCYGTDNCYLPSGAAYGVLSTSDSSLQVAYPAHKGWDFATGLGTVNVTNLVNSWK